MKPRITVSINPTYLCNFRCNFCYLTPQQLADRTTLSLDALDTMLENVASTHDIVHADIYGGEISVLSDEYAQQLLQVVRKWSKGSVNVVTNLYRVSPLVYDEDVELTVSYDFHARERHQHVLRNIQQMRRPLHILVLATPVVLEMNVDDMINVFNSLPHIKTVEIKPYSSNQANKLRVTHTQFEEFVKKWLTSPVTKTFDFTNRRELDRALSGSRNSFSDDHVYITPFNKFAVLEFDLNGDEYFKELESFDDYLEWTILEKSRVFTRSYCNKCQYLGRCMTEHIRHVDDVAQSCNGYYTLIEWYKRSRHETLETR